MVNVKYAKAGRFGRFVSGNPSAGLAGEWSYRCAWPKCGSSHAPTPAARPPCGNVRATRIVTPADLPSTLISTIAEPEPAAGQAVPPVRHPSCASRCTLARNHRVRQYPNAGTFHTSSHVLRTRISTTSMPGREGVSLA
jgi:hypothetical protein